MLRKHDVISMVLFLILSLIFATPTLAQSPETTTIQPTVSPAAPTTLEINAVVPEGFTRTILLNFVSANQENLMFRLESVNGYLFSQKVKPGSYNVDFINIVGGDSTAYQIESSQTIEIEQGNTTFFKVQIFMKPIKKQAEVPNDTNSISEEGIELILNEAKASQQDIQPEVERHNIESTFKVSETLPQKEATASVAITPTKEKFTLAPRAVNIIIVCAFIALAGLLIFLYKQIQYKHDYYDC